MIVNGITNANGISELSTAETDGISEVPLNISISSLGKLLHSMLIISEISFSREIFRVLVKSRSGLTQ